jgi:hypothetical protein
MAWRNMKHRKVFVSRKLEDGKVLKVEVLDVGQDDLVLLTVSIALPEEPEKPSGEEDVPWESDDEEMYFFESKPHRWRSYDVADEIVQLQVDHFARQLKHPDPD